MPIWKWDETISAAEIIDPIDFFLSSELTIQNSGISLLLLDGVSLNLIQNFIKIPVNLDTELDLLIDLSVVFEETFDLFITSSVFFYTSLSFNLVNGLEIGLNYKFLNSLNSTIETLFLFDNSLTNPIELEFITGNKLLGFNEVSFGFNFHNKLGLIQNDVYEGFYFSKIHGV